jgi:hypothetical protein
MGDYVIYTQSYCIENEIYRNVDLAEVTAIAAGLDVASVRKTMGYQEAWMHDTASKWKDWVQLCLLTRSIGLNCHCNYGRPSQVNHETYGNVLPARVSQMLVEISAASGLPAAQFDAALQKARRTVDNVFARRQHDRLFKGKWYPGFLAEIARGAAGGRPYNPNGLEGGRMFAIATAIVDVSKPWCEAFRKPLEKAAALF